MKAVCTPVVGAFLLGIACGMLALGLIERRVVATEELRTADFQAELEQIKGKLPDQAHAMQDVAYHFTNLWFAGQKQHWDLAKFYLGESKSHLRWAVRIIPRRKDRAGQEINLEAILQATENGPLMQVEEAIAARDSERFDKAYRFTLETCYACHKTTDKPYLRPQIPTQPEVQIINFDPQADWPK